MSALAPSFSSDVPCLAGLYLALGADDAPSRPAVSPGRRALAAAAACLLALSVAVGPAVVSGGSSSAGRELPAGTLPEPAGVLPGDVADFE